MFKVNNRIATLFLISLVALSLILVGCSSTTTPAPTSVEKATIKVGATAVPHAEILEFIKPILAEKGIDMEIIVFNDYVQPNLATDKGEIDANYFQHEPYLETFCADHDLDLVSIAKVHLEPMGIYSKKFTSTDDFEQGETIAIPNDPSNAGRALAILQTAGLIELKEGVGIEGTIQDISSNPKEFDIKMIEAAQLPRVLTDPKVAGAVINTNFALEADLNPTEDALYLEDKESPYANIFVVRADRKDDPILKEVAATLNSDEVRTFIEETYKGAVIPAF